MSHEIKLKSLSKQEVGPRPTRASLLRRASILKQQADAQKHPKIAKPNHPLAPALETMRKLPARLPRPSETTQLPLEPSKSPKVKKSKKKKLSAWNWHMVALKNTSDDSLNSDIEAKFTLPPIEARVTPPQSPPSSMCTPSSLTDIALILPTSSECSVTPCECSDTGELKTALTDPDTRINYLSSSGLMSSRFEHIAPSQLRRIVRQAPNFTFQERESGFVCNDRPGYKIVWQAELEDGTTTIFDPTERKYDKLPKGYFHFGFASVTYKYAEMMWEAKRKLRQVNGK